MNKRTHFYGRVSLALAGVALVAMAGAVQAQTVHHKPAHHNAPFASDGYRAKVAQPPAGIEKASRQLMLSIGEGEIINLPAGVTSVWTSNPAAADVYVNNNHQIHLFGKTFGDATVFATSASGAVIYSANVMVAQNSTSVDSMLRAAFPDADIRVSMAGQMAVLTGTVATPLDSAQAEQLVKSALNPGVKVSSDEGLKVLVINRLKTATPLQVHLRVRIAEVTRSWARQIGNSLATQSNGGTVFGISRGTNPGGVCSIIAPGCNTLYPTLSQTSVAANGSTQTVSLPYNPATGQVVTSGTEYTPATNLINQTALSLGTHLLGLNILDALNIGEQAGLVTTLAEPDLTALSGETADFLAGGEFPIPVSSGLGVTTVQFKDYGVSLSFTPTVLANGSISLHVRPEVSQIDTSHAVTLNGYSVPGLTTRHAETTLEMGSGQSMMIAGLLSINANHTIEKLPGAGDIPVLGALFKSTSFQKGETELVIVVTPYLVNPVNDGDIKLPTDALKTPTEIQRVLGNMLTDGKTGGLRPGPTSAEAPSAPPASGHAAADKPTHAANADSQAQPGFSLN